MTDTCNAVVPQVSVILAVYNGETYLEECLLSICEQSLTGFEFIVVDDASTDGTPEILRRHAAKDARITVLTNERNKERSASRNKALAHARADLVAVVDADDIALPDRLEKQVAFMGANSDVLVCGGAVTYHETGENSYCPTSDESIRAQLLWTSPFAHPTVMFRRGPVLKAGGYDPTMPLSEDYDLWVRLAALPGWRFANLDMVLGRYRIHPHTDRRMYRARQMECASAIMKTYMRRLGIPETALDMEAHLKLCFQNQPCAVPLERAQTWVAYLMEWNRRSHMFVPQVFDELCLQHLHDAYVKARWLPAGVKRLLSPSVKNHIKKCIFAMKRHGGKILAK